MRTYKVLSALLGYPDGALLAAANDMRAVLDAENCLPSAVRAGIEALIGRNVGERQRQCAAFGPDVMVEQPA